MNQKDPRSSRPVAYYDGDCPMCSSFTARLREKGAEQHVDLRDFRKEPLPSGIEASAAEREIHLVDQNGQVLRNIDALARLSEYAGMWPLLRKILLVRPLKPLLRLGYRIIAANRFRI